MHRRLAIVLLGTLSAWVAFAWLAVPALIRSAYRGESVGFLNRLIKGQAANPVESYLGSWSGLATRLTFGLALALALVYGAVLLDVPGRLRRWSQRFAELEAAQKQSPVRPSPLDCLLIVLWWGLAAGVMEALYLSKKMILGEWLAVHMATSAISVWMAPLSYAIIFGLLGLAVYGVARIRPGWLRLKWVLFGAAMLAFFSIFRSTSGRLELYGVIPLAAGLALVSARLGAAYSRGFLRFARRSIPVVLALVVVTAVGIAGKQRLDERREVSRLPAASADQPNVLLLILDTVRSKSLSVYGYARPTTPSLERLAERGVVFDRALATAPWTLPTHATVFTGRHHHELSVNWTKGLDETFPTLAEVMRDRGYNTGGFVGNFYYGGPQFGLDRGFVRYRHKPVTLGGILASGWLGRELLMKTRTAAGNHQDIVRNTAADINREFLDWQSAADPSRPFFAFLNYFDAHSPYLPPEPFDRHFSGERPRYWLKDEGAEYTAEELSDLTEAYDNSIAYLDDQLGRLFDELEARGVLENTLVIVTSDHGEQFGEHRLMYHSNSLYMPLLHVPLIISFPAALPSGVRIEEPVSVRDIAATVADILGIGDSPLPGRSMAGSWTGDPAAPVVLSEITMNRRIPDWMPAAYGPMQSLVVGRYHYIRRGDGAEELYDWVADPEELADLAGTETARPELEAFRARLDALLQPPAAAGSSKSSEPSMSGEPEPIASSGGSSSR